MKPTLTLHDTEAMVDAAFPEPPAGFGRGSEAAIERRETLRDRAGWTGPESMEALYQQALHCTTCKRRLTEGQLDTSLRLYGQPLCPVCQKARAEEPADDPAAFPEDAVETRATEAARRTTPGDIRRALSHRAEVPGKHASPGPWVALTGYALGLLALAGGLAWVVEWLPGGWREKVAVGVGVGLCWVVGRGTR